MRKRARNRSGDPPPCGGIDDRRAVELVPGALRLLASCFPTLPCVPCVQDAAAAAVQATVMADTRAVTLRSHAGPLGGRGSGDPTKEAVRRHHAVVVQRETLLQRWALALELAAARQAAAEAETVRVSSELGPAMDKAKKLGKKVAKVERERLRLRALSNDMAASAAELHQLKHTQEAEATELHAREKAAAARAAEQDARAVALEALEERERAVRKDAAAVSVEMASLRERQVAMAERDSAVAKLEREGKERVTELRAREAAAVEREAAAARAAESHRITQEALERQLVALEADQLLISQVRAKAPTRPPRDISLSLPSLVHAPWHCFAS